LASGGKILFLKRVKRKMLSMSYMFHACFYAVEKVEVGIKDTGCGLYCWLRFFSIQGG
jgi:hypothetical protein